VPSTTTEPAVDGRRTDTRQRLVQAAMRLFAARGYAGTSVAEIEGAVGLRPGSGGLYRHFPSKEALLLAAVEQYHARVRELRAALAESRRQRGTARTLAAEMRDLVGALAQFLATEQPVLQVTLDVTSLPAGVRPAVAAAWDDGYGMAADILTAHGVAPAEAGALAVAAIGSLSHYAAQIGTWGQEPFGVPVLSYLDAWSKLWEGALRPPSGRRSR